MGTEQFKPEKPGYKKVKNLPKEQQEEFVEIEGGELVRKETDEKDEEAKKLAGAAKIVEGSKEEKKAEDSLQKETEKHEKYKGETLMFDTFDRKYKKFEPLKPPDIGMYSCGPTVYSYQHIGNLRTYIFSDIVKRVLECDGYKVKQVMNVTDVGHLTSDADTGEDKIEIAAQKEGKKAEDIVNYYWKVFREDFKKLNISEPNIWCKASEHIKEQLELIKKLEERGFTYKTSDGIYFDTSKLKDYGKIARLDISGLKAGVRVGMKEKKNPTDFALWKFSKIPGERQQEWGSPWGTGFPGWHLECSAMSMKYLGETFDIHTGGVDHIPVHHTNEIAQSEAATGKKFVNYWLHGDFLLSKGEKISKSKGGLYTVSELQDLGFNPLSYRYSCLTAHYRSPLNFSLDGLKDAQNSYDRLKNIVSELKDDGELNAYYLKEFEKAINNDFDMPKALSTTWNLLRDKKAKGKYRTIAKMDQILGLSLIEEERPSEGFPEEIKNLVEERKEARTNGEWARSDELRRKIEKLGWRIKDTKEGPKIYKKTTVE